MPLPERTSLTHPVIRQAGWLLASALLGPLLFLAVLTILYGWLSGYCLQADLPLELTVVVLPALLTLAALRVCRRAYQHVHTAGADDAPRSRTRAIAYVGLTLNGFSLFLFLGLLVPILLLRPCD